MSGYLLLCFVLYVLGLFFIDFFCGLIALDLCKLIHHAAKLLGKKLGKDKKKKEKTDEK